MIAQLPPGHELALDEVSGQLVLMVLLDPLLTQPATFLGVMGGFLDLVPKLRRILTER